MPSLKLFNRQSDSEGEWLNRYADVMAANVRLGRTTVAFTTVKDTLFGIENILTVYLAAQLSLDGSLTVGMIFAFMSYRQLLIEKGALLIEKIMEYRILDLHLERLGDIAFAVPERGHDRPLAYTHEIQGRIPGLAGAGR